MRVNYAPKLKPAIALMFLATGVSMILAGCAPLNDLVTHGGSHRSQDSILKRPVAPNYGVVLDEDVTAKTYHATEVLLGRTLQPLDKSIPILVASLVDVDHLDQSSSLGRFMAEAVSDRMVQLGYNISEVKLRDTLAMKKDVGQLILSRNLKRIRRDYNAQAFVAGTYAVGRRKAHISLKLINADNGRVISATTYTLNLGPDTRTLLSLSPFLP